MGCWTTEIDLRDEWVDYLGHITATAHLALFEEARALWLATVMDDDEPAFVLARQELDYRSELLRNAGSVTVSISPVALGRSSVTVAERLSSGAGLHTESRAVLVRWNTEARSAMAFPALERSRIEEQMSAD